jgi:DNA-binding transcriptional MerR regulator
MWKPGEGRLTIMFSIGEFSKIAQVTKRQLRFYDEMGLLPPASVGENGRRFYSAKQLADLNRILALQQLGFALEQVRQLGQDDVPLEELRGMLKLKQAESERRLHEEAQRLRAIASRLEQIERSSREGPLNVVLKRLPEQRVLSVKLSASSLEEATGLFRHVVRRFPEQAGVTYGHFFVRLLSDAFEVEALYGEIGRVVTTGTPHATRVDTGLELAPNTLPAEEAWPRLSSKAPYTTCISATPPSVCGSRRTLTGWRASRGKRCCSFPELPTAATWLPKSRYR